jgi:branched-chain amino acid transport system ATP-binding protein
MKKLLTIENIHVSYGSIDALKNVSLHIQDGEVVAVLGANGAGKSTLLRCISGLVSLQKGNIFLFDKPLKNSPPYDIVQYGISHSPEGRRVFATLTVEENLNLGAYVRRKEAKENRQAKERIFELFPLLKKRRRQLAGTLSGGEQQMLAMGRALMSNPRVLLLDEPSLGLSPLIVKHVFEIIREINSQGVSILLVEQNARKALSVANRGYVLETGKISISGTSTELKSNQKVQEAYLGGAALKKHQH